MASIRSKFTQYNSLGWCFSCFFAIAVGIAAYGCGATKRAVATEETVSGDCAMQLFVGEGIGVSQERAVAVLRANDQAKQHLCEHIAQIIAATSARYSTEVEADAASNFESFVAPATNMALERTSDKRTVKLYDGKYTCSTQISVNRDTVLHCLNSLIEDAFHYNKQQFEAIFCDELARLQPQPTH